MSYLEKLKPLKFEKDSIILKNGSRPKEVMFIMSGNVLNKDTGRIFSEGAMCK